MKRVCIIGSGVAGSTVAAELLATGRFSVHMLEAGAPAPLGDQRKWHDYVMQGVDPLAASPAPDEYVNTGADYKLHQRAVYAAGGTTLHWIGRTPRLAPEDFEFASRCGYGLDWPFGYEHLEPYYVRAERTLQVCGEASDSGVPPRSAPFPLPPMPYAKSDDAFLDAMDRLGYATNHPELARNTQSIHGRPQCQTIGTCGYCPIGARFTGDQALARLNEHPGFTLETNCSVQRLLFDDAERARRVEYLSGAPASDASAEATTRWTKRTLEADAFIVAAGGLESPAILQASTGERPSPFSDQLGRNLFIHLEGYVRAPSRANPDLLGQETYFATAASRHFDSPKEQATGKYRISHFVENRIDPVSQLIGGARAEQLREQVERRIYHSLLGEMEQRPRDLGSVKRLGAGRGPSARTRFGLPLLEIDYRISKDDRATFARFERSAREILAEMGCPVWPLRNFSLRPTAHPMGTCRMAERADEGVVDANAKVHGAENVYVAGSSVFPTGGCANPTLTLVALAHRLGDHLADSL